MYHSLKFGNAEGTLIQAERLDGTTHIVEPTFEKDLFGILASGAFMPVAPFVAPPPLTDDEVAEQERAGMSTVVGKLRIAILRAGETDRALEALEDHPEQAIIWETGGKVSRRGFLSKALETSFSDTELDGLFRAAMNIKL